MILFLGVCKALKAMHHYRVGGGPGGERSTGKARKIRGQAARADVEAAEEVSRSGKGKARADVDEDDDAQPLMDDEVTAAQEGVAPGQIRAYAHRDIKPGMFYA